MTFKKENTNQDHLILNSLRRVLNRKYSRNHAFNGTMTQLHNKLSKIVSDKKILPKNASALRVVINRVVNKLRNSGVSIKFVRSTDRNRTRLVKMSRNNKSTK